MVATRSPSQAKGEELVRDLELPIDPFAIAKGEGIEVVAKRVRGASGMFIRVGDNYVIAYATDIDNVGLQRFSVAHELGHYFLPGHGDHVLDANQVHKSVAQFRSKEPYEIEADQFAVGLLMPTMQFRSALGKMGEGFVAVEELASLCNTSLVATTIRVVTLSPTPMAAVVSGQDEVEYCVMSESFKNLKGLTWLEKRVPLPKRTATYDFVADPSRILRAERAQDTTHLHEWFGTGPDVTLVEEVVGLGRYGKVLTVLSLEDDVDVDELDEDEGLEESWTPRFKR